VEKAKEVMHHLESNKAAALVGPRGVGKSTLAKYVAYTMLKQEQVDYVVVPEGPVNVNELLKTAASLQRRVLLLFDVHPREVYTPRFLPGAAEGAEKPLEAAARAINSLLAAAELDPVGRLRVLGTAPDDELRTLNVKLDTAAVYRVDLGNVEFLADIVKSYIGKRAESCRGVENLARIIK
jgi:energy-coupling factor transporter ATP-binding protein EcfA2